MISRTARKFRKAFANLPVEIQRQARRAYRLWLENPNHPGLHFKLVDPQRNLYSVRIGRVYRALGVRNRDRIVWLWIGRHEEYEDLLK